MSHHPSFGSRVSIKIQTTYRPSQRLSASGSLGPVTGLTCLTTLLVTLIYVSFLELEYK